MSTKEWMAAGLTLALLSGHGARAQEPAPPATIARDGVVAQVLVNPHGEPDGLLLRDGTLVRFPPHAVADPARLLVGLAVHAEGEPATTPNGVTLFDARVSAGGRLLADATLPPPPRRPPPPGGPDGDLAQLAVSGRVRLLLADPDGVVDGFLLDDGTVVHAGPRARLSRLGVAPGARVTVVGRGGAYPQGRSVRAQTVALDPGDDRRTIR